MKKTVNEGGITLIALVVTIVVLLILAAITITYVLADDGIFGKAKEAAQAQEIATMRDYISNAQATLLIEYNDPTNTEAVDAEEIMKANFPSGYTVTPGSDFGNNEDKFVGSLTVEKGTKKYEFKFTDGVLADEVTVTDTTTGDEEVTPDDGTT